MSEIQRFNVICVTKRYKVDGLNGTIWHSPITGIAEVYTVVGMKMGVGITKTVVCFQGGEYNLLNVRSGLSGTAVTLTIDHPHCDGYEIWELYTDTPTEGYTAERVREIAKTTGEKRF